MTTYTPQIDAALYTKGSYRTQDRWNSYWHQLVFVRKTKPERVLEVGVGNGVVARELRAEGIAVTTLDIDPELMPDIVGSITEIPLGDDVVDTALASEIIEHIRFEDVEGALRELARVSTRHVVIGIPHPGYVFSCEIKIPLLPRATLFAKLPFFFKTHTFNGQHYWELGKRGYSFRSFVEKAERAGLRLLSHKCYADDPAHRYFLFAVVKN